MGFSAKMVVDAPLELFYLDSGSGKRSHLILNFSSL